MVVTFLEFIILQVILETKRTSIKWWSHKNSQGVSKLAWTLADIKKKTEEKLLVISKRFKSSASLNCSMSDGNCCIFQVWSIRFISKIFGALIFF